MLMMQVYPVARVCVEKIFGRSRGLGVVTTNLVLLVARWLFGRMVIVLNHECVFPI